MTEVMTAESLGLVPGFDAAFCPDPVPLGYQWCEVYAGGSSATRQNGWTDAELARVAHLPRLVVWVPTPGFDNPRQSALGFLNWLWAHGVPDTNAEGEHTRVMWDLETGREPDAGWLNTAANVLSAHGDWNVLYGSTSWLFGYPVRSGYCVADPTGFPHMYPHPGVVLTQWNWGKRVPGGVIDEDLATADLVSKMWQPEP